VRAGESPSGRGAARRAGAVLAVFALAVAVLFFWAPDGLYLWIKALHVIAVISWMAGLLYLPRLFVNHVERAPPGSPFSEGLKLMERRLLRIIITPAMVLTWVLGLWLGWNGFRFEPGWLQAKMALVLVLTAFHGYLARGVRRFAEDRNTKSARHWRMANEIPALLMIGIVVLAVVKPF
jgi:protoporphyrinogen IX oxidase